MDNEHVSPFYDYLAGAIAGKTSFFRNGFSLKFTINRVLQVWNLYFKY